MKRGAIGDSLTVHQPANLHSPFRFAVLTVYKFVNRTPEAPVVLGIGEFRQSVIKGDACGHGTPVIFFYVPYWAPAPDCGWVTLTNTRKPPST